MAPCLDAVEPIYERLATGLAADGLSKSLIVRRASVRWLLKPCDVLIADDLGAQRLLARVGHVDVSQSVSSV